MNVFYNLLLHVQGVDLWTLTCFLNFLWLSAVIHWKKRNSKILGCFQPSVVVPNHINCICSVCLPECNKKQIFLLMFQDRTYLITQSFFIYFFIYSV